MQERYVSMLYKNTSSLKTLGDARSLLLSNGKVKCNIEVTPNCSDFRVRLTGKNSLEYALMDFIERAGVPHIVEFGSDMKIFARGFEERDKYELFAYRIGCIQCGYMVIKRE